MGTLIVLGLIGAAIAASAIYESGKTNGENQGFQSGRKQGYRNGKRVGSRKGYGAAKKEQSRQARSRWR